MHKQLVNYLTKMHISLPKVLNLLKVHIAITPIKLEMKSHSNKAFALTLQKTQTFSRDITFIIKFIGPKMVTDIILKKCFKLKRKDQCLLMTYHLYHH